MQLEAVNHADHGFPTIRRGFLTLFFDLFLRPTRHGVKRRALRERIVKGGTHRGTREVDVVFVIHFTMVDAKASNAARNRVVSTNASAPTRHVAVTVSFIGSAISTCNGFNTS